MFQICLKQTLYRAAPWGGGWGGPKIHLAITAWTKWLIEGNSQVVDKSIAKTVAAVLGQQRSFSEPEAFMSANAEKDEAQRSWI